MKSLPVSPGPYTCVHVAHTMRCLIKFREGEREGEKEGEWEGEREGEGRREE